MKRSLQKLVDSHAFSNFILAVVFVNSAVLGLQTSKEIVQLTGNLLEIIDKVCLWIFVAEAVLKIGVHHLGYFKKGWNLFDFTIVVVSFASDFAAFSSIRALRIVRIFRALKFISGIKNLQNIVNAIAKSIPSIGWTALLMLIVYYIFAVIGTMLFAPQFPEWFGSMGASAYTLFQVMTLDSWSMEISRPVMDAYPYAWLYFVPFVVISSFVILNIVVGIVVNSISSVTSSKKDETKSPPDDMEKEIEKIQVQLENLKKRVSVKK